MTRRDNAEHENPPPTKGTLMYTPTIHDIRWAHVTLLMLSEGGVLQYSTIPLTYRVSHKKQTLTLMNPELLRMANGMMLHLRTKATFKAAEYQVIEKDMDLVTASHQFEFHTDTCSECDREEKMLCPIGEELLQEFFQALVDICRAERMGL